MAALARLMLAHGGTAGLIIELGAAVAIGVLLLWSLWRNRRAHEEEGGR